MRRIFLILLLLLLAAPAWAQKLQPSTGIMMVTCTDGSGNVITCAGGGGGGGGPVTQSTGNASTPWYFAPLAIAPTDRGGTITTGGTAQNAMASNASRKGGWVQNPCSATEDLYVSTSGTATTTAGSPDDADLGPCGTFSLNQNGLVNQNAVSVVAATTGHAFIAKETQ